MSSIFKKISADKMAFKHHPKPFTVATSAVAKEFVTLQGEISNDFRIADVVAAQSGVKALQKQNIESQVEGTVLERLKEIEEQAYAAAYELGLTEGREKAFQQKQEDFILQLKNLDSFLLSLEHRKINTLKENEASVMKLMYSIAQKIALREITLSQEPIVALLTDLISEVQGAEAITVKLSPADFDFIEVLRQRKVKEVERLDRVKLLPTDEIETGGCIIETNFGEIDATIAQRVEKAWQTLEAKLPVIVKEGS